MTFVLAVHTGAGNAPNAKKQASYSRLIQAALDAGLDRFKMGGTAAEAVMEAIAVLGWNNYLTIVFK